jgi:hypothetical protein
MKIATLEDMGKILYLWQMNYRVQGKKPQLSTFYPRGRNPS